ncbi:hypothetical protein GOP47_0002729 [Adiantum capillus-veneris]|uniref:Neprosin PEP catalytic domain-containing protein n=1 Tax=Adiantum capillus-veneris TaxID=13818 RepID=A0A9D4VC56_ADICA|nr:hypothetical protein GOP47_0002729 [Adiantum capillus-veneris]
MGKSQLQLVYFAFICCFTILSAVSASASAFTSSSLHPRSLSNLTRAKQQATPAFSVATLQSHHLSNGVFIDCVRLSPANDSTSNSPSFAEARARFPTASSGWRKLTKSARAHFEAEVPTGCSLHPESMAVQRGDIFEDIVHIKIPESGLEHCYALYSSVSAGYFTGATSTISINTPSVQDGEISIAQIWVVVNREDDDNYSTLEAGWIVYPEAFGDGDPRLFIFWTNDNYQHTGCFNRICPGFVQTNTAWTLGEKFPSGASIPGNADAQISFYFGIFKDPNDGLWYFMIDNTVVGHWDPTILTNFQTNNADEVQYGGEVQVTQVGSPTQMGSGFPASNGFPWAAYMAEFGYTHESLDIVYFSPDEIGESVTDSELYQLSDVQVDDDGKASVFFYGGWQGQ